jgi:hypothetical protein
MRNFLLALVVLISACNGNVVENQIPVDSVAVMTDTTLPHPQTTILDTVALKSQTTPIRPTDDVIAAAMSKNTSTEYQILDTMTGDLNRDKYMDMLIVLQSDAKFVSTEEARPLLILIGTPSGDLKKVEENDSVVLCEGCGGVWGDPYDGLAIKNGFFSVEHYGGSSDRWTEIMTFKYSEKENTWILHRQAGVTYSVFDPEMKETEQLYQQENWGKVKFTDYNYNFD